MAKKTAYASIFLLLLLLASCSTKVEVHNTPLNKINDTLSLNRLATETMRMSGYYTANGNNTPDGPFIIESDSHPVEKSPAATECLFLNITGEFNGGEKTGEWIYNYEYSDGGTLYEKYAMTFFYENGKCQQGSFQGVIGREMPMKKYDFQQKQLCNPMQLREMVMDLQ